MQILRNQRDHMQPTMPLDNIHDIARRLTRDEWYEMVCAAITGTAPVPMPGLPPEELQLLLNGRTAAQSMGQAFQIYEIAMNAFETLHPRQPDAAFLDFGAGWGRIWRYFLRDFAPVNMSAFDIPGELETFWTHAMLGAQLDVAGPFEPLPFDDESFDLVVSNSVFSHLTEPLNRFSAGELARIMKPGAIFVGTTFGSWHLRTWQQWRAETPPDGSRKAMLSRLSPDFDETISAYREGRFVLLETPASDAKPPHFEIACFNGAWLQDNWTGFELVTFDDERNGQALFILRRT